MVNDEDKQPEQDPEAATDPKFLEILVCPITKTSLQYDRERQELVSRAARMAFPIRGGVPYLTIEFARHLDD